MSLWKLYLEVSVLLQLISILYNWPSFVNLKNTQFILAPGKVQNLQQKLLKNNNVELTWDAPFARGNDVITYIVMYGGSTKKSKEAKFVIESDTQDQTLLCYGIRKLFPDIKG